MADQPAVAQPESQIAAAATVAANEIIITKEYNLDTKIREYISEILQPVLKKTEECVKTVDFFSNIIDTSTKKFDECFDIYEVLREKCKLRFKEIDALTLQVAQIGNDQIIDHGQSKQEIKELKQEIVELTESLSVKSQLIELLSINNERVGRDLLDMSNRIHDTRGDYSEKIQELIKEQFTLTSKNLEAHNNVFDVLQSSIDLYKVERADMNQKIADIHSLLNDKVPLFDYQMFSERIERQLQSQIGQERNDRNQQLLAINSVLATQLSSLTSLSESSQSTQIETNRFLNQLQETADTHQTAITKLQKDTGKMKLHLDNHQSQLAIHQTAIESLSTNFSDLKQRLRKDFLKYDQTLAEMNSNLNQTILDQITKNNMKFKYEVTTELSASIQKVKDQQNEHLSRIRQQSMVLDGQTDGIESMQQIPMTPGMKYDAPPIDFSDPLIVNQLETIILRMLDVYDVKQAEGEGNRNRKNSFAGSSLSSAEQVTNVVRNEAKNMIDEFAKTFKASIQANMLSPTDLKNLKEDLAKIDVLKGQVESTFEKMQVLATEQTERIERMSFKMTTIQSDITIQNDYVINQLKRVIKDKDTMLKTLAALSSITAAISETSFISSALVVSQEIANQRKLAAALDQTESNPRIPTKIFSNSEGLIFDTNESSRGPANRLSYRMQMVDRADILINAMQTLVSVWEGASIDNSPGKVFKNQIMALNKANSNNASLINGQYKIQGRANSSSRAKQRAQDDEVQPILPQQINKNVGTMSNSIRDTSLNAKQSVHMPALSTAGLQQNQRDAHALQQSQQQQSAFMPYSSNATNISMNVSTINPNHNLSMRSSSEAFSPDSKQRNSNPNSNSASMSLNHRKLLNSLKDFNQTHLINIQKHLTTPNTIEKQRKSKLIHQSISQNSNPSQEVPKRNISFMQQQQVNQPSP